MTYILFWKMFRTRRWRKSPPYLIAERLMLWALILLLQLFSCNNKSKFQRMFVQRVIIQLEMLFFGKNEISVHIIDMTNIRSFLNHYGMVYFLYLSLKMMIKFNLQLAMLRIWQDRVEVVVKRMNCWILIPFLEIPYYI